MLTKVLVLTDCTDGMMWYAKLEIGSVLPLRGNWIEGYHSIEPAGYSNVVHFKDARVAWIELDDLLEHGYYKPPKEGTLYDAPPPSSPEEKSPQSD
jgi:hypothetical protein